MKGMADRVGSIEAGKTTDLLLVDGEVEADLGKLRRVDKIVLDGTLMDADALRKAAGFSERPGSALAPDVNPLLGGEVELVTGLDPERGVPFVHVANDAVHPIGRRRVRIGEQLCPERAFARLGLP
jgi:hypothetical protein